MILDVNINDLLIKRERLYRFKACSERFLNSKQIKCRGAEMIIRFSGRHRRSPACARLSACQKEVLRAACMLYPKDFGQCLCFAVSHRRSDFVYRTAVMSLQPKGVFLKVLLEISILRPDEWRLIKYSCLGNGMTLKPLVKV